MIDLGNYSTKKKKQKNQNNTKLGAGNHLFRYSNWIFKI